MLVSYYCVTNTSKYCHAMISFFFFACVSVGRLGDSATDFEARIKSSHTLGYIFFVSENRKCKGIKPKEAVLLKSQLRQAHFNPPLFHHDFVTLCSKISFMTKVSINEADVHSLYVVKRTEDLC